MYFVFKFGLFIIKLYVLILNHQCTQYFKAQAKGKDLCFKAYDLNFGTEGKKGGREVSKVEKDKCEQVK